MTSVPDFAPAKLPDAAQVVFLTGQVNMDLPNPPELPYTLELVLRPPAAAVGWILLHGGSEILRVQGSSPKYLRDFTANTLGVQPEKHGRFVRMTITGPPGEGFTGVLKIMRSN